MHFFFLLLLSYFLGSIPFGKLVGNLYGIDIQKKGSGNIGFANCVRVLGLRPALVVLFGDIVKGIIPMSFAIHTLSFEQSLLVAFMAILGHIFPCWLKFKGGKGIATGIGVLFLLSPLLTLLSGLLWIVLFACTKLNALASIIMIAFLPFFAFFIARQLFFFSLGLLLIGIFTHRQNIDRLLVGQEKKLS